MLLGLLARLLPVLLLRLRCFFGDSLLAPASDHSRQQAVDPACFIANCTGAPRNLEAEQRNQQVNVDARNVVQKY